MLNAFLCLVLWLVIVFVSTPIGIVYAHFTADVFAVPLSWTTHKNQTWYFDALRVMHVISIFCIVVGEPKNNCCEIILLYACFV